MKTIIAVVLMAPLVAVITGDFLHVYDHAIYTEGLGAFITVLAAYGLTLWLFLIGTTLLS